jgi:hypothetical protein
MKINGKSVTIPKDVQFSEFSALVGVVEDSAIEEGFRFVPLQVDASGFLLVKIAS